MLPDDTLEPDVDLPAGLQTAPRLHATVLPRIRIRVKMCRVNATSEVP